MSPPELAHGITVRRGWEVSVETTDGGFFSVVTVVLSSRNLGQRERAEVEGQTRVLGERLRLKQLLIEEGVLTWREKQVDIAVVIYTGAPCLTVTQGNQCVPTLPNPPRLLDI